MYLNRYRYISEENARYRLHFPMSRNFVEIVCFNTMSLSFLNKVIVDVQKPTHQVIFTTTSNKKERLHFTRQEPPCMIEKQNENIPKLFPFNITYNKKYRRRNRGGGWKNLLSNSFHTKTMYMFVVMYLYAYDSALG